MAGHGVLCRWQDLQVEFACLVFRLGGRALLGIAWLGFLPRNKSQNFKICSCFIFGVFLFIVLRKDGYQESRIRLPRSMYTDPYKNVGIKEELVSSFVIPKAEFYLLAPLP
jgi:hypothetical protein